MTLLVGDDLGELLAGDPGVGGADEAGIGRAVLGEPGRALVGGEVLADGGDPPPPLAHVGRREPRRRCRLGRAVLVHEHRQQAGEVGGVEVVEQPGEQALGDEQVGLVEERARGSAASRSATSRARRRSRAERARRARWSNSRASDWLWPSTRPVSSTSSRSSRSVCPAARIRWRRSGSDSTGCGPGDAGLRDRAAGRLQAGVVQRPGDVAAVLGAVRAERRWQADGAERAGHVVEVVGGEQQRGRRAW